MEKEDLALMLKALSFAAEKHRDQRRKDIQASPYINHPIDLANILVNEGGVNDVQVISGALLHDTVEDTDTEYDELLSCFGQSIADIVMEVTDDKTLSKAQRKQMQIDHAPDKSEQAKLVKLADKISNLRDLVRSPPADWSVERKLEYFNWAKQVIDGVRGVNPSLEQVFDQVYQTGISNE